MIKTAISFEFFPPKTDKGAQDLEQTALALAAVDPIYMTVTYGAGGSTRDGTLKTVTRLQDITKIPMASHLTFCSTPKADLDAYIDALWNADIKHIIALRGDLPAGKTHADFIGDQYYQFTSDFVEALRARHDFDISVGAYPEKHPDAPSLAMDIEALKKKCDAGATRAITQFFFDNDIYYRFIEQTQAAGIRTPIVPGMLPIGDFVKMQRFAATCNTTVPDWLHEAFARVEGDAEGAKSLAIDLLAKQMEDLAKNGVRHLHLYSMNRSDLCLAALDACGITGQRK